VAHIPWVEKLFRIPPAIYEEVCKMIKRKIDAGVYEPSNSSYQSRWFCVIKKDGKSLRIVHSLEPLNRVTIAHSGLSPATEELAMHFAGRACSGILDLYIGYNERVLAERSRDLTTFQTPFGALRLVTLPMGWTNSVPIFHDDVTYILHQEIPRYTLPYIDDVPIRGLVMGIKRFDHETKVKARSERRYLQTASQLCTKQVGTGEINQTIESLLKVKVPKNNQNILNRSLKGKELFLVSTRENPHCNRIPKARVHLAP